MALIDASRNHFFELAKERWQAQGFDADITDILEGYRAETNKKIKKDSLPSDFYKLLELMTISRSRKHITSYYGDKGVRHYRCNLIYTAITSYYGDKGVGQFPEKNKPDTYNSDIDTKKELLHFRETNELLEALILSVYTPTRYIKEEYKKLYIEKYSLKGKHGGDMNFDTQANGIIILHRFNLIKRLESSVYSFEETLRRLLERIERTEQLLLKGSGNVSEEDADFDDNDSEDVYIEGKYEIDITMLYRSLYQRR